MSDSVNTAVLETMAEQIQQQKFIITQQQAELERLKRLSVEHVLGQLRLREALLLYVGDDASTFSEQLAQAFGSEGQDIVRAVSNQLFILDRAPVSPDVREAIRKAVNYGMSRW